MKFLHMSDLHLGKVLNFFPLIEDQVHILEEIKKVIEAEQPDAIIIAGDIYDKRIASTDAIHLFDSFLEWLYTHNQTVFIISGNHDEQERLAVGRPVMAGAGIYISPVYDGTIRPITLTDAYGPVRIYMLPFLKATDVSCFYKEELEALNKQDKEKTESRKTTNAISLVCEKMQMDTSVRNVLVTHLAVKGGERSESEIEPIGGEENVDASVFKDFDYVALGHLHKEQTIGSERVCYSGSPLKYSMSERNYKKGVTIVEMGEKGSMPVLRQVHLTPLHDMRELSGRYMELMNKRFYEGKGYENDYIRIVLTDEEEIPDAMAKLKTVYRNIMELKYDNTRTRHIPQIMDITKHEQKKPLEVFSDFYKKMNGKEMDEKRIACIKALLNEMGEDYT